MSVLEDDIAEKTARDLQWSELLQNIARYALSEDAAHELSGLRPFPERGQAELAQRRAAEALHLLQRDAPLPIVARSSLRELCSALQRQAVASAEQLRDAGRTIDQAIRLRHHCQLHEERCPELKSLLWCAPELSGLRERITRAIDDSGQVLDSASEGLQNARRGLQKVRSQLRETGNQLMTRHKDALSGQYLAERAGRFVLPVRADAPERVGGMILGSSGSGGTLYIEPRELSELNNRVYIVEAEVLREEAKVLWELSQAAQGCVLALQRAEDNCVQADKLAAIARWALHAHAITIGFAEQPELHLLQMRHPLLLAGEGRVVASDLHLQAEQCLVVSGPNAGGKTVALKCLGLAVWLSQSGLPIPCDPGSTLGWFQHVLTDIGDEQSISRSLSTFSAHIQRLAHYLDCAERGYLVLLDEIAGGTDPDEGAALATAILQGFVERGAALAVTTHYERLKRLGASEDGAFVNVSVGFDWALMLPTFALTWGTPGRSSALAVAERYGIPASLVEKARELLPQEQLHQQALLSQLERERTLLELTRQQVEAELTLQRQLREQAEADAAHEREQQRKVLSKEAQELTQEVLQARDLVRRAKIELGKGPADAQLLRQIEQLVSTAAEPVALQGKVTQALGKQPAGAAPAAASLVPGARVHLPHLGAVGEVLSLAPKGLVRVSVGGLKLSVPIDQVRAAPAATPKATAAAASRERNPKTRRTSKGAAAVIESASSYVPVRTSWNTCDLRGMRVEAGLEAVATFVDRMLQANESAMFVLHGHGTGAMKDAVREYLGSSSVVSRWEPASREDGGDALTLCWL